MKPVKQAPFSGFAGFGGGLGTLSSAASDPTYVEDVYSTFVYEGNGSARTIANGIDLSGEGGLVWIKNRDDSGGWAINFLFDTERAQAFQTIQHSCVVMLAMEKVVLVQIQPKILVLGIKRVFTWSTI